jgi:large subunit ribosomal protein L6
MSRIGKQPVAIPEKVEVKVGDTEVVVKGPNGSLTQKLVGQINVEVNDGNVIVTPTDQTQKSRAMWGLYRTLMSNMIHGVTQGFTRSLEFNGVGYKAAVSGNTLTLNLGYSHPINYELPEGVAAKVTKNVIELSGNSKELVGFVAAKVRSFRPPEPYKGKGIKYSDETIIRKAGKTGAKK